MIQRSWGRSSLEDSVCLLSLLGLGFGTEHGEERKGGREREKKRVGRGEFQFQGCFHGTLMGQHLDNQEPPDS